MIWPLPSLWYYPTALSVTTHCASATQENIPRYFLIMLSTLYHRTFAHTGSTHGMLTAQTSACLNPSLVADVYSKSPMWGFSGLSTCLTPLLQWHFPTIISGLFFLPSNYQYQKYYVFLFILLNVRYHIRMQAIFRQVFSLLFLLHLWNLE